MEKDCLSQRWQLTSGSSLLLLPKTNVSNWYLMQYILSFTNLHSGKNGCVPCSLSLKGIKLFLKELFIF